MANNFEDTQDWRLYHDIGCGVVQLLEPYHATRITDPRSPSVLQVKAGGHWHKIGLPASLAWKFTPRWRQFAAIGLKKCGVKILGSRDWMLGVIDGWLDAPLLGLPLHITGILSLIGTPDIEVQILGKTRLRVA